MNLFDVGVEENKKYVLQSYENCGIIGKLHYGVDDSDEDTWVEHIVRYPKNVIRSRQEAMKEQALLYRLDIYEEV